MGARRQQDRSHARAFTIDSTTLTLITSVKTIFFFFSYPLIKRLSKSMFRISVKNFIRQYKTSPPPNPPYWLAILFSPTTPRPVPRSQAGPLLRKGKPNSGLRAKDLLPDSTSFDPWVWAYHHCFTSYFAARPHLHQMKQFLCNSQSYYRQFLLNGTMSCENTRD